MECSNVGLSASGRPGDLLPGRDLRHSEPQLPYVKRSAGPDGRPPELTAVLDARDDVARERAWRAFIESHSRILLHAVHSRSNGYDDAMDRYTYVLENLSSNDFRKLRGYTCHNGARFSTWLVVVAGRLCVDYYRKRYGTPPDGADRMNGDWHTDFRRRLADLVSARLDLAQIGDGRLESPDLTIRRHELERALAEVVAELEPRDRLLLRLRFYEGMPAREIADVMAFPTLFHVYRRLKVVLRTLRDGLHSRGVIDPTP